MMASFVDTPNNESLGVTELDASRCGTKVYAIDTGTVHILDTCL